MSLWVLCLPLRLGDELCPPLSSVDAGSSASLVRRDYFRRLLFLLVVRAGWVDPQSNLLGENM